MMHHQGFHTPEDAIMEEDSNYSSSEEEEEEEDENTGARAYAAISSQLESWTTPSSYTKTYDDDDDDDDDEAMMEEEEEVLGKYTKNRISFESPMMMIGGGVNRKTRSSDEKGRMLAYGEGTPREDEEEEERQLALIETSSSSDSEEEEADDEPTTEYKSYHSKLLSYLRSQRLLSKRLTILHQEEQLFRSSPPPSFKHKNKKQTTPAEEGIMDSEDEAFLQLDKVDEEENIREENLLAELRLLQGFSDSIIEQQQQQQQDSTKRREKNVWLLLRDLRSLGPAFFLYNDSVLHNSQEMTKIKIVVQKIAKGMVNKENASVVKLLFGSYDFDNEEEEEEEEEDVEDNEKEESEEEHHYHQEIQSCILLQRRKILLKWIQSCHAQTLSSLSLPSKAPRVEIGGSGDTGTPIVWADTLKSLGASLQRNRNALPTTDTTNTMMMGGDGGGKVKAIHPDAPLLLQKNNFTSATSPLYGNDEQKEVEVLNLCLTLLKSGKFNQISLILKEYGFYWRSSMLQGGTPLGTISYTQEEKEDENGEIMTKKIDVGNPNRALWKRQCWKLSHLLSSSSSSSNPTTTTKSVNTCEAALYAILSSNLSISKTSICNSTWEDLFYLHMHAMMNVLKDEMIYTHNSAKRSVTRSFSSNQVQTYPFRGTQYEQEEENQLNDTFFVSTMKEADIFSSFGEMSSSSNNNNNNWYCKTMEAFIVGKSSLHAFLTTVTSDVLTKEEEEEEEEEENVEFLRFLTHLVIYLDVVDSAFLHSIPLPPQATTTQPQPQPQPMEETYIKNAILQKYVSHLIQYSSLWTIVTTYAALLPLHSFIDSYSYFLTLVYKDDMRQVVLAQSRGFAPENVDLVVLRRVVRNMLHDTTATTDGNEESAVSEEEKKDALRALRNLITTQILQDEDEDAEEREEKEKSFKKSLLKVNLSDARKMGAIHWLCYTSSHAGDALLCCNMLLRQLLLEMEEEEEEEDGKDGKEKEKEARMKMHTAKVFLDWILPMDTIENAREIASNTHEDEDMTEEGENEKNEVVTKYKGKPLPSSFVSEIVSEFDSLRSYLDAHTCYERWSDVLGSTSPIVSLNSSSIRGVGGMDEDITKNMERRSYIRRKRQLGQKVAEAAGRARDAFMAVMTHPNGWLAIPSTDKNTISDMMEHGDEEYEERREEMIMLRSLCLPRVVLALHQVLDSTACWMERFLEDAAIAYGSDGENEEDDIVSLLLSNDDNGGESDEDDENEEEDDDDDQVDSPLSPAYWHKTALSIAEIVARDDHDLSSAFSLDDMKRFMELMAESAVKLLHCSSQKKA